jgi:CRP/FNR family transcriptional regulator, cyclic AMP receptor protein
VSYEQSMIHAYLSQVPMFRSCDEEQLAHLSHMTTVVDAHPGKVVVRQGEAGAEFYVVMRGKVTIERDGVHLRDMGPGEWFGELALFDPAPRNATITAAEETEFVSLSRDAFLAAITEMPSIRDALLHGMAHRIHELEGAG